MTTLERRGRTLALLATAAIALTACGSSTNSSGGTTPAASATGDTTASTGGSLSGTLAGAGSSAQKAAQGAWAAGFQTTNSGVTVNYDPVGSGSGVKQFTSGGTDFGGSDKALTTEQVTAASKRCGSGGTAIDLPVYISPIAVAFNVGDIKKLNLKPATIAMIFNSKITNWNDPAIKADNPDATLPDLAITPVHRQDASGTTANFTDYLSKAAPDAWSYKAAEEWPVKGGEAAQGTSGVVAAVKGGNGTIGYADASQVVDLGKASVGVGSMFTEYSAEAAAAVVAGSPQAMGRMNGDIVINVARDTTKGGQYPIVLVSYELACTKYQDAAKAMLVKAYLEYISSSEGQMAAAKAAGSAPISDTLRKSITDSINMIS